MLELSAESLAAMLANAYQEGWNKGHDLIPIDPRETFLECLEAVEGMCTEEAKH